MLIPIVIIVVVCWIAYNKWPSTATNSTPQNKDPYNANVRTDLNPNSIQDICYALGCLLVFSAMRDSTGDELMALALEIDRRKMTTSIYAHGKNLGFNASISGGNIGWVKVPERITTYLDRIPFQKKDNDTLAIDFDYAAGSEKSIMENIDAGVKVLPIKMGYCRLRSYDIGGNPLRVKIELDVIKSS